MDHIFVEFDRDKLIDIENVTNTHYYYEHGLTNVAALLFIAEDLLEEIHKLEDKIQHLENDLNDNYRPIPVAEQIDIGELYFN